MVSLSNHGVKSTTYTPFDKLRVTKCIVYTQTLISEENFIDNVCHSSGYREDYGSSGYHISLKNNILI